MTGSTLILQSEIELILCSSSMGVINNIFMNNLLNKLDFLNLSSINTGHAFHPQE